MKLYFVTAFIGLSMISCSSSDGQKVSNDTTSTEQGPSAVGGKDADELGRKILQAFKKNDLQAYLNCIKGEDPKESERKFAYLKDEFQSDGLSDWSKAEFSRVKYLKDRETGNLASFEIEFTYGSSFRGVFAGGNYAKEQKGRFYIHHAFYNGGLIRN